MEIEEPGWDKDMRIVRRFCASAFADITDKNRLALICIADDADKLSNEKPQFGPIKDVDYVQRLTRILVLEVHRSSVQGKQGFYLSGGLSIWKMTSP